MPQGSTIGPGPVQPVQPQTGMVTLLFTDIVSSVPLKQRLGDKAGAALIQQQRALVSHLLTTCPGAEEIETAGEASSSKTGTYLYMAPELFAGKPASTRSDLYSLGVVLYQLLVGDLARPLITDGRVLCTVGDDAAIGFWNVATGREMLRFDGICQSLVIYLEIFPHHSCDDRVLLFGPFVSEPGESGAPDPLWRYRVTTIPTLAEIDSAP